MRPAASKFPKLKRYFGGEPYFDAISDAHIDLIALAFACDVTRFATLLLGDLSYEGNPLDLPPDNHGNVAHTYDGSPVGSNGNPIGQRHARHVGVLAKFNRYAYGKVARMMDKLTEYGVVDSTLVYASSEMGNPSLHSTRNVPTVLAAASTASSAWAAGSRRRPIARPPTCLANRATPRSTGPPTTTCWSRSRAPSAWPSTASARSQTPPTRTARWPAFPDGCVIETPLCLHIRNEPTSLPRRPRTSDRLFERGRQFRRLFGRPEQ